MRPRLSIIFLLFTSTTLIKCQRLVSPCPTIFTYEPQTQNDRWYGVVTLVTDSELSGIWLRLKLDTPAIQLGNWFGEVKTDDNISFLLKNRNFKLPVNTPYRLRFYIQYDPAKPPPQVEYFRLNARTFCPEGVATTTPATNSPQLMTSSELSTTPKGTLDWRSTTTTTTTFLPIEQVVDIGIDESDDSDLPSFIRPQIIVGDESTDDDLTIQNGILEEECGVLPVLAQPIISHGLQAKVGEFPWHVAIYHNDKSGLSYKCGGSLISRKHVITAAHCVCKLNTAKGETLPPEFIVVYLGKDNLRDWSSSRFQLKDVERIVRQPEYDTRTHENDIAVIKLSSAAMYTDTVRPICLWENNDDIDLLAGQTGIIAGFGYDEFGKIANALIKTKMPVKKQTTCIFSLPGIYKRYARENTFCAGFINGTTVCNGDSGGGLIFSKTVGTKTVHYVRGIASLVLRTKHADDNRVQCTSEHYPIFTDVAKHLDFIKTTMKTI